MKERRERAALALKSASGLSDLEPASGISALEAAIQEASAAGVDPSEVSSAQSRLQQMKERRERAALALKSASGISALEAAIQEALAAGVDPGDVSSAQSRLQEMTKEQQQQDDEMMSSLYEMTSEEYSSADSENAHYYCKSFLPTIRGLDPRVPPRSILLYSTVKLALINREESPR